MADADLPDVVWQKTHRLSPEAERSRRIERVARILLAYQNHESLGDICEEFDTGRSTVHRYVREAGLRDPRRAEVAALVHARHTAILAAYRNGVPIAEIAAANHCSQALVSKLAAAAGILRYKTRSETETDLTPRGGSSTDSNDDARVPPEGDRL